MLENSNNPFAVIILAQLDAIKSSRKRYLTRYQIKLNRTKRLLQKRFTRERIIQIYHFLDRLMVLPSNLEIQYKNDTMKFEEEHDMAYVSSIERLARQEGLEQGIYQGQRQIALLLLKKGQSIDFVAEVTGLSLLELKALKVS